MEAYQTTDILFDLYCMTLKGLQCRSYVFLILLL